MNSWFLTRNGRIFTYSAVGVFTTSCFGAHILSNGPLVKKWEALFQQYQGDEPKPISPEVLTKAENVLKDLNLSENAKRKVSFFCTVSLDLLHFGTYSFPWGVTIGLPSTFESNHKFRLCDLKLIGKDDVDWAIEGLDVVHAMKLSEAAQRFAIAREVYSARMDGIIQNAFIAAFSCSVPAGMSYWWNRRISAFQLSMRRRIMFYSVFYAFGVLCYICVKNPLNHFYNLDCDRKAAIISPEYLSGGIDFYKCELEKNKALREIMGKAGKSRFTEEGNVRKALFAAKFPITSRLENLKQMQEQGM